MLSERSVYDGDGSDRLFPAVPVRAQNLEAARVCQIFAGTCMPATNPGAAEDRAGILPGFLRQHYTTPARWRAASGFLVSNGAADTRYVGTSQAASKDRSRRQNPQAARLA